MPKKHSLQRIKNPDNQRVLSEKLEKLLIGYQKLFNHIYTVGDWEKCKKVIIYYFMFLYGFNHDINYLINDTFYEKIAFKGGDYVEEQYDIIGNLGVEFDIIKAAIRQVHKLHKKIISPGKLEKLNEYYEILKLNFNEFLKDYASCKKLPNVTGVLKKIDIIKYLLKKRRNAQI